MALSSLPVLLRDDPVAPALVGGGAVVAVPEVARPFALAGLAQLSSRSPMVVAVPTTTEAERLASDLGAFLGEGEVAVFPAWETLPFERVSPSTEAMGRRLRCMWELRRASRAGGEGRAGAGRGPSVIVAPARALVQRLGPHVEDVEPVVVARGEAHDPLELVERLVAAGYRREGQVEHRGEVARRGSIVDVYPSTAQAPVRVDLWGDEVDRLSEFAVADQRSTGELDEVVLFPTRELLPTKEVRQRAERLVAAEPWARDQWERLAEGLIFEGMESWLPWLCPGEHTLVDLVPPSGLVVVVDPRRLRDRASDVLEEEEALADTLAVTWGAPEGRSWPRLHVPFDRLVASTGAPVRTVVGGAEGSLGPGGARLEARGWEPVLGDADRLHRQVAALRADGYRLVVVADGDASAFRLEALLAEGGTALARTGAEASPNGTVGAGDPPPGASLAIAPLDRGFVVPSVRLAVLTEGDLTGRRRAHRPPRPRRRDLRSVFEDLRPGDYVVHHHHGVARYGGMVRRAMGPAPGPGQAPGERDYLLLEYRGGDKLYVPSDQIDAVTHYTGGEAPTLNRLGGSDWARTRGRVRAAVAEIAQELIVLYQRRAQSAGHAFGPDGPWQAELEDGFGFQETPDQLTAITVVKADMESPTPMDRLVCGDVGFGKTEVALRAAFKAVQDGKQVAVLVPTTLLAQQHHATFSERFAPYPLRVEVLSRFLTAAQAAEVVEGLATGAVDVVIGTHRLLSADVGYKDLGLLVVDEEQRFGVSHKEAIKALRADVDVLTLSATPIPRTLELSLTGLRDLTLLNTPPPERQPILTHVGPYDERAVSEALRRELLREGQVFFVHNRVADIDRVAGGLAELVPEARIAVAHGQMDEGALEQVVLDFWQGAYDVLVCTTIIESGIDMPTVNTLVVDRADLMGLGQLHQLRGRVGRAGQRAYAYLFHPPDRRLTEEAYERLRTIGEATELGSGFKIAMRDLEIRGAGNLLGTGQSGHIAAVGYDLYVRMVSETVAELKGEPLPEPAEIRMDLGVDAHLAPAYVGREEDRLEAYRRLATVTAEAEVADIAAEWADRYGPPPPEAAALLDVARLRATCARLGVREVSVARGVARLSPLGLKASQQVRLRRLVPDAVFKEDAGQLVAPVPGPDVVRSLLGLLGRLVPEEPAPAATPGA